MGLDGVELVMEVEDAFKVCFTNDEAASVTTVGQLNQLVLSKLGASAERRCLSGPTFYQLRRALTKEFRVERRKVRPQGALRGLLPVWGRRRAWRGLQDSLGLRLPPLARPAGVEGCIFGISILLTLVTLLVTGLYAGRVLSPTLGGVLVIPFTLLAMVFFLCVGYLLTWPLAVLIPAECRTVGGAVETLVAMNYHEIAERCDAVDAAGVRQALTGIIVRVLGVPPDRVTENAHFVKDLGMN